MSLETFHSELCVTVENFQPLEIEDKTNITLCIKSVTYTKMMYYLSQEINICKRLWIFVFC